MIKSNSRGHDITYKNWMWLYVDTLEPISETRECKKCGKKPTPEGYDACIGFVPGATSVCCGHGNQDSIIKMNNKLI